MTSCAVHRMAEQVGGDVTALATTGGQRIGLVKQAAHRHVSAAHAGVTNVVEVTERVRIVERPVLAERLSSNSLPERREA